MIIETLRERICLSGRVRTNQWAAVRTAAHLLLAAYPDGVIIDCSCLDSVSDAGEMTFIEAIQEIEFTGLPIMLAHLPHPLEAKLGQTTYGRLHRHLCLSLEAQRLHEAISSPEWWERLWGVTE